MTEHELKNNSYVYIPVDKLEEIMRESCPPDMYPDHNKCLIGEVKGCRKCWLSWLKDGDSDALD